MKLPYTTEQIERACIEAVAVNQLAECYIRPLVYRGYSHVGVNPIGTPIEVVVAAYPWGKYLGEEATLARLTTGEQRSPYSRSPKPQ